MHEQPRDRDRSRGHHRGPGPEDYGRPAPDDPGYYGYPEPPGYRGQHGHPGPSGDAGEPRYAGDGSGRPGPAEYLAYRRHRTQDEYPDYPAPPPARRPGGDPGPPPARRARPIPPEAYQALFQQAARGPRWPYVLLMAGVALIGLAAGVLIGSRARDHPPAPAAATSPATAPPAPSSAAAASAAAPSPAAPARVLARFSGSGTGTTRRFTVPGSGNWELKWSYDCASLGVQGNFAVTEDQADPVGVAVNELGLHGHGVSRAYRDAGRHYLAVDSECAWRLAAVAQP